MNNLIFIILILTYSQLSFAQQKRLNIGLSFSSHSLKEDIFLSTGVSFQYNFKNNLSLRTGLEYDRSNVFISNFYDIPYPIRIINKDIIYRNLELPISVRYSIGGKFKFFGEVGIVRYFYLTNSMDAKVDFNQAGYEDYSYNEKFKYPPDYKYNADLIVGTSYQLKNNLLISFSVKNIFDCIITKDFFFDEDEKSEYSYNGNTSFTELDYHFFQWLKFSLSIDYSFNIKKKSTFLTKNNGYDIKQF